MRFLAVLAKSPALRAPWVKYAVGAIGLALWGYGLVAQLGSTDTTMMYLGISLLIAAIAVV